MFKTLPPSYREAPPDAPILGLVVSGGKCPLRSFSLRGNKQAFPNGVLTTLRVLPFPFIHPELGIKLGFFLRAMTKPECPPGSQSRVGPIFWAFFFFFFFKGPPPFVKKGISFSHSPKISRKIPFFSGGGRCNRPCFPFVCTAFS